MFAYAKAGLKIARIFSRRHRQMTFSDAHFLGILRVKTLFITNNDSFAILKNVIKFVFNISPTISEKVFHLNFF